MRKSVKIGKAAKAGVAKKAAKKSAVKTKSTPKAKSAPKTGPAAVTKKPVGKMKSAAGKAKSVTKAKTAAGGKKPAMRLKTGTGKSPSSTKSKGTSGAESALLAELRTAAAGLDADGIRTLIRQAAVLKHNMRVTKEHAERKKMATVDTMRKGGGVTNKTTIDVKEADDGSSFIIIINNARNFFALDEMRKLVAICHAAVGEADAARRLYNWFDQYRKDVLIDTDIGGATDPALGTMYRFIKGKYALKQG